MNTLRRTACLLALSSFLAVFPFTASVRAGAGDLDPTFGTGGKVIQSFSPQSDYIQAIALQTDGKIVAIGSIGFQPSVGNSFGVARFNTDGSVDKTFGSGGSVTTQFDSFYSAAQSVAIQPDGKIIVVGGVYPGWLGAVRYNPDGTLDKTFAANGKLQTVFNNLTGMSLAPDGKIVAVGDKGNSFSILHRYTGNGAFDKHFGHLGKLLFTSRLTIAFDTTSVTVQADGKIVVGGYMRYNNQDTVFFVARFNPNGMVDRSFSDDGFFIQTFADASCVIFDLEIQPDNKIIMAGHSSLPNGRYRVGVARINPDGTWDPSFQGGRITTDVGNFGSVAYIVRVQNDGKVVIAGSTRDTSTNTDTHFIVIRYNSNGSLDTTFAAGGKFVLNLGSPNSEVRDLAIQNDGKIVAGGFVASQSIPSDFALVRLMGN